MARRAAAAAPLLLGQLSLFSLPLCGAAAQTSRPFQLHQPQDKVSVPEGGTLTLTCTTTGDAIAGPVKWLKGWGSDNKTIYDQKVSNPRVTRVMNGSDTDFTILINDFRPEDAGTYYCVKFRKSVTLGNEVLQRGSGTVVSLREPALIAGMVAAAVVLCFLLLLGLFVALCMYRRKRRGEADAPCQARPVAMGKFSAIPLRCCAGTPDTPSSEVLDAETSHLPNQVKQSRKEDNDIHYADLQPLPAAPWRGRSPGAACSEYASVRVAAK